MARQNKPRSGCLARCLQGRRCIFCAIVAGAGEPESRVVYQDERLVVLPDIRPAAAAHLLVLPRRHVPNVTSLTAEDTQLVRDMLEAGRRALEAGHCADDDPTQIAPLQADGQQRQQQQQRHSHGLQPQPQRQRQPALKFGFHKPPFRSVDHLHLHCFRLPHKWHRWWQYQCSLNWVEAEDLLDELARRPSPRLQQGPQGGGARGPRGGQGGGGV